MMKLCGEQPASEEKEFTRVRRGSNWRGKWTTVIHRAPQEKDINVKKRSPRDTDDALQHFCKKKKKKKITLHKSDVKSRII